MRDISLVQEPWTECPTVWEDYCEEKGWDPVAGRERFLQSKAAREQFRWFYLGFDSGGCS